MVATLEKSTFPCGDSDDDFHQDFQMLDNSDLYFKKLDLPTENKKQLMRTQFFMSDVFDKTHDCHNRTMGVQGISQITNTEIRK